MSETNYVEDENKLGLSCHQANFEIGVGDLIELSNANLKNLACLRECPQVKKVKIVHSVIENLDIFNICEFNNLVNLNLSHNEITSDELDQLNISKLLKLNLSNNKISNLGFLKSLAKLESFNISNNRISSLDELEHLQANKMLKKLNLTLNPIVYETEYLNVLGNNLRFSFELQKIYTFDTEEDDLHFLEQIKLKQTVMELETKNEAEKVNELIDVVLNSPHTTNLNKNRKTLEQSSTELQTENNPTEELNNREENVKMKKSLTASENFVLLRSRDQNLSNNQISDQYEHSEAINSEFHGQVGENPINLSEIEMTGLMDSVRIEEKLSVSKRVEAPQDDAHSEELPAQTVSGSNLIEEEQPSQPADVLAHEMKVEDEMHDEKWCDVEISEKEVIKSPEKEPLNTENNGGEEINEEEEEVCNSENNEEMFINGVPLKFLMSEKLEERFSEINESEKPSSDDFLVEQKTELKESMIQSFNNSEKESRNLAESVEETEENASILEESKNSEENNKIESSNLESIAETIEESENVSIQSEIEALKEISNAENEEFKGSNTEINFIQEQMNIEGLDDSKDPISMELEENLRKAREILFGNQTKSVHNSKMFKSEQSKSMRRSELQKSDFKSTKSIRFEDEMTEEELEKTKQEDAELRKSELAELVSSVHDKPYKSEFMAKVYLMKENERLLEELKDLSPSNAMYELYEHIGLENVDEDVLHGALLIQVEEERQNKKSGDNIDKFKTQTNQSVKNIDKSIKLEPLSQMDLQYSNKVDKENEQEHELNLNKSKESLKNSTELEENEEDNQENSSTEDIATSNVFKQFEDKSHANEGDQNNNQEMEEKIDLEPENVEETNDISKSKSLSGSEQNKIEEMAKSIEEEDNLPIIHRKRTTIQSEIVNASESMSESESSNGPKKDKKHSNVNSEIGDLLKSYEMQKDEMSGSLSKTREIEQVKASSTITSESLSGSNVQKEEHIANNDEIVPQEEEENDDDIGELLDHLNGVIMDQETVINEEQEKLRKYKHKLNKLSADNTKKSQISQSLGFSESDMEKTDAVESNMQALYEENPSTMLSEAETRESEKCALYSYEDVQVESKQPENTSLADSVIHTEEVNENGLEESCGNIIIESVTSDRPIGQLSACGEQVGEISSFWKSQKGSEKEECMLNNAISLKVQNKDDIQGMSEETVEPLIILSKPIEVGHAIEGRIPANFASSTVEQRDVNPVYAHPRSVISEHFESKGEDHDGKTLSPSFSNILLVKSTSRSSSKEIIHNKLKEERCEDEKEPIHDLQNVEQSKDEDPEPNKMENIMTTIEFTTQSPKSSNQSLAKRFPEKSKSFGNRQLQTLYDRPMMKKLSGEMNAPESLSDKQRRSNSAKRPSVAKSPMNASMTAGMRMQEHVHNMIEKVQEQPKIEQNVQFKVDEKPQSEKPTENQEMIIKETQTEQENEQLNDEMVNMHQRILEYIHQREEEHKKTKDELLDWKIRFSEAFIVIIVHIIFTIYMLFYKAIVMFFKSNKRDK